MRRKFGRSLDDIDSNTKEKIDKLMSLVESSVVKDILRSKILVQRITGVLTYDSDHHESKAKFLLHCEESQVHRGDCGS